MGQELRPYQQQARDRIHAEWDAGHARTLLVLPTGTGKTIVFASVAADQVRAGDRVLILAHRGELLEQAADKLQRSTGLVSAVEKAESTCLDSWFRVVVGSVQTLQRTARLERFPQDYFGTIIIDEAHHAITDGYRRILDYFSGAKGDATVTHRLYLHTKTQGLLGAFFESIGQCKRGETFRPRWNEVVGAKGICKLGVREYTKQSGPHAGETGQSNEVQRFLPPPAPKAAPSQGWTQGAF